MACISPTIAVSTFRNLIQSPFIQNSLRLDPSIGKTYQLRWATLWQLHTNKSWRNGPEFKTPTKMECRPQMKGIVLKLLIKKPRKPNSGNRRCVKVRLSNGKEIVAYIPGEGHTLQEHSVVLVDGHKKKDVPGLHYRVIRGAYDCTHVKRKNA
ncbi:hypothetical protein GJ496_010399 [Pomphorhynchus laevis]|nr:hypothetical protein GJ496_010399 [Pomphorhynchus laevis]